MNNKKVITSKEACTIFNITPDIFFNVLQIYEVSEIKKEIILFALPVPEDINRVLRKDFEIALNIYLKRCLSMKAI